MIPSRKSYFEKLNNFLRQHGLEENKTIIDQSDGPEETLEVFLERLKNSESASYSRNSLEHLELTRLVDTFSTEEIADFVTDLLIEDEELLSLPLFQQAKYTNVKELAFDWLMDLPYATLQKVQLTFQRLYEHVLSGDSQMMRVMEKINAIVIKNRTGLPFDYLMRRIRDTQLPPEIRLQIGNLLIKHQQYDLDFASIEQLLNIEKQDFFLPILMRAYLLNAQQKDDDVKLKMVTKAIDALNHFRQGAWSSPSQYGYHYLVANLEAIQKNMRQVYPDNWEEQLSEIIYKHLQINSPWLQRLLDEQWMQFLPAPAAAAPTPVETVGLKHMEEQPTETEQDGSVLDQLKDLELDKQVEPKQAKTIINAAIDDPSIANDIVIYLLTSALQKYKDEGAALHFKPFVEALVEKGVDINHLFSLTNIVVSLHPYTIEARFMPKYDESETPEISSEIIFSDIPRDYYDISPENSIRETIDEANIAFSF